MGRCFIFWNVRACVRSCCSISLPPMHTPTQPHRCCVYAKAWCTTNPVPPLRRDGGAGSKILQKGELEYTRGVGTQHVTVHGDLGGFISSTACPALVAVVNDMIDSYLDGTFATCEVSRQRRTRVCNAHPWMHQQPRRAPDPPCPVPTADTRPRTHACTADDDAHDVADHDGHDEPDHDHVPDDQPDVDAHHFADVDTDVVSNHDGHNVSNDHR